MHSTVFDPQNKNADVTALLMLLSKDIDGLTHRVVTAIRREIPAYADFPFDVHFADNVDNIRNLTEGLIRFAPPDKPAIDHARFMGRQRALAHLPLSVATEGYHVAYAAYWQELLRHAELHRDGRLKDALTGYVAPLWHWFHQMSAGFSSSYLETESSLQATRSDKRAVVHEALRSELIPADQAREAAESLGFAPASPATVIVASPLDPGAAPTVASLLDRLGDPIEVIAAAPETVILVQGADASRVAEMLVTRGATSGAGIGREQPRFELAGRSYADARRAFACTHESRRVARFADVWPVSLAMESSELLADLLRAGVHVCRRHPQLAHTVAAFADNRFSLATTARAVHLHPNTAKYRLKRWEELTGWDVYTVEGLISSLTCLELVNLDLDKQHGTPISQ